jgi:hypothetical protein
MQREICQLQKMLSGHQEEEKLNTIQAILPTALHSIDQTTIDAIARKYNYLFIMFMEVSLSL